MKFLRDLANTTPINDTIFTIVKKAKADIALNGPDNVINATIGTLCDENAKLVAFNSVYNSYNNIENSVKASYAQSFVGNREYIDAVDQWLYGDINLKLHRKGLATIGGSGAISATFLNSLDPNETVIFPNVAWGSYKLMADQFALKSATYNILQNGKFDFISFKEVILETAKKQKRILVVINDPCQNPTGYSMTEEEWKQVIDFVNTLSKKTPVIILNDIAYIDFSFNKNNRKYMEQFNNISKNVTVFTAFTTSKSLTQYGLRCGALIMMTQSEKDLEDLFIVYEKSARGIWSNVPNGAMINFSTTINENKTEYLKEKQFYIDLLKQRADLFINQAIECKLPTYQFKEGFFVTLKVNNETRDKLHSELMENHIYTIKTNLGIRVAICSTPLNKIDGLACKIKEILDTIE
jgi:aspartate aminotransferase/aromatic-amino-acid transaminase